VLPIRLDPGLVWAVAPDIGTPYSMTYLFNIQRQLGANTTLEAGYNGALHRHLQNQNNGAGLLPGITGATTIDRSYQASSVAPVAAVKLLHKLGGRKTAALAGMLELGSLGRVGADKVGRHPAEVLHGLAWGGVRRRLIAQSALDAGMDPQQVFLRAQKAEAIDLLKTLLGPGDLVLIKGSRGMVMEDVVTALAVHEHLRK